MITCEHQIIATEVLFESFSNIKKYKPLKLKL